MALGLKQFGLVYGVKDFQSYKRYFVKIHVNLSVLFCMQVLSNPILLVYMMKRLSQKILSKPGKTAPTKNPEKV